MVFRCFSQYLYFLQPSVANRTIINKHRHFVKFSSGGFQFYSPCGFRETPCGFEVYYQELTVQFLFHQESIVCAFFRLLRHQFLTLKELNKILRLMLIFAFDNTYRMQIIKGQITSFMLGLFEVQMVYDCKLFHVQRL